MTVTIDGTNGVTTPDVEVSSGGSASAPAITVSGDTNTGIFFPAADTIAFDAGGSERARIDSSGNLLVGKTTTANDTAGLRLYNDATDGGQIRFSRQSGSATQTAALFFNDGGGSVGSITTTSTATAYNTSSDYRLKENIAPMTGALATVAQLNPVTYNWKSDGSAGQGFIAHELQEVAPYAVSGEKDGEQMQGVDYGKLTPILTAALQEAIAKIETLEARIAVLEAK